ncbi:UDP-4-amino-4,6-dideoxy-N-acetyl-beta-L-altrosamine transaminase [Pelosinus sp. sgz500959]|uniref:UDP-4-amino-4, 6-dideoxy-N-acetyl-beta-L-altrosamine transaminase n=1 Tax=Pelosinus sp. sgz500959 TaxID=3242472 RepID=UPI00366C420D
MRHIPYGRQDISEEDIEAVVDVLKTDWLTQGPTVERFEQMVAEYCGAKYAVAVNSATSALHIACMAAELQSGDCLWTSPNTFVASANCGLYCDADVDFVDIDEKTYNMSSTKLAEKLSHERIEGRLPKVVIPVHFAGQSCDMVTIAALAAEYDFTVIEDASHAIGGSYRDSKIGSCRYSDMTVFSFHPVKIVTTGEGGIVVTNRQDLYVKLLRLRSHGITRNSEDMMNDTHGPWYYEQIELGFNYRMTDIQAGLGISQMKRIDEFINKREEKAEYYTRALQGLPLTLPYQNDDIHSAWHLYVVKINNELCSKSRRQVFEELRDRGLGVNVHYIPVHTQPYYRQLGFSHGDFPVAEQYYEQAISIPMFYRLTNEEQDYIIQSIKEVLK